MKTVLNYYLKRKKGTEREIEHNTYAIILAIGMFIGVVISDYTSIAYWVGFMIIFLPMSFNRQYKKIIQLKEKNKFQ